MKSKTKPLLQFIFSLVVMGATPQVWGAACCGGGFAAPALIAGDDRAQITASYAYSQITDDVGTDSLWRGRSVRETSETLKVEGAHIFQDRWQVGATLPVVRRTRVGTESTGLGDISGTVGYEYLPDWDYHPWRPKGLGFIQLTLPTGKSIHESNTTYQLDSRGRGFWAVGVGTLLTKIVGRWDVFSSLDVHKSFDKSYANSESRGTLKPGWGGNLSVGGGYNSSSLRLGSSLTWTYEDAMDVSGTTSSPGVEQRLATWACSASYLLKNEWATTVTYSDQTLFGSPLNTSLGRGVTLFLQKRWLR